MSSKSNKNTKYIFVTGGVISGVGKGITAASIGAVLKAKNLRVSMQKCDPYFNIDAGLLNPAEHGECFVTFDGAETDLDLGSYERFLNKNPQCQPLEPVVLRYLFAKHTKVDVSYMRGYVNVYRTKGYSDSQLFQFEIPSYGGAGTELIAKATGYTSGAELKVVWDEEMADLYTLDGKFIMSCPRVIGAAQSHAEASAESNKALGRLKANKENQTAFIDEFESSLNEVMEGLSYEHSMALGGNKETYNAEKINNENTNLKNTTKKRVDRDFNSSDWSA